MPIDGTRLRQARIAARLTQRELGTQARVHDSDISHYEAGRTQPDTATCRRIADALHVPVRDLLPEDAPITLAVLRWEAGLTQGGIARRLDVSTQAWRLVEIGQTRVDADRAARIADALTGPGRRVTADDVLRAATRPVLARPVLRLTDEQTRRLDAVRRPGEALADCLARVLAAGIAALRRGDA